MVTYDWRLCCQGNLCCHVVTCDGRSESVGQRRQTVVRRGRQWLGCVGRTEIWGRGNERGKKGRRELLYHQMKMWKSELSNYWTAQLDKNKHPFIFISFLIHLYFIFHSSLFHFSFIFISFVIHLYFISRSSLFQFLFLIPFISFLIGNACFFFIH